MKGDKILVTGANGFLGSALARHLSDKFSLVLAVRSAESAGPAGQENTVAVGNIDAATDWSQALAGVDTVVHCAARAHVMSDESTDPLDEYRKVNVAGSLNLARQAVEAKVRRFIFISSIGLHGVNSVSPFNEESLIAPQEPYAVSKLEAELALQDFASKAGLELVIIRPPLVYGAAAPGNFGKLFKLADSSLPLPFGAVHNKRTMVYLGNLCHFIENCITHPSAANQTFVIADGEDVSLRELLVLMRKAQGRRPGLLPVPVWVFRLAGRLTGRQALVDRLVGDLQVDTRKAQKVLGWKAPYSVQQGVAETVAGTVGDSATPVTAGGSALQRLFDIAFAACGLVFGFPVLLLIYLLGLFDTGSPLFLQERVGRNKKPFTLVKFRTMQVNTASVASHLASASSITRMGGFLRKTKLDELPQLWNVLKGEMSLVGPRPNLFNQHELIAERDALGVYAVRPGITGLAQVNEIDMSTPKLLAETDARMIREMSPVKYFRFIVQTVTGKGSGDRVRG